MAAALMGTGIALIHIGEGGDVKTTIVYLGVWLILCGFLRMIVAR